MHADQAAAQFAMQAGTVFTDGVFDLLNRGHIAYLGEARQSSDRLLVAIHGDASARILERETDRPMNREGDHAFHVAALESVDAVIILNEAIPAALLSRLRPAVYVKGGDDDMNRLAEGALVQSGGGHALTPPFVDGVSAPAMMDRIRATSRLAPADAS